MKRHYMLSICITSLTIALGCFGCATRVQINGGGTIPSSSGEPKDKSNFGFFVNNCTPGVMTGEFNYHDKKAPNWSTGGVKFIGEIVDVGNCSETNNLSLSGIACGICNLQFCDCDWPNNWEDCVNGFFTEPFVDYCPDMADQIPDNMYGIGIHYTSTNPRYPGSGTGVACVTDNGQGRNAIDKDNLVIILANGIYQGYVNQGSVQGNAATEPCCHDLCLEGFPPVPSCDPCVEEVCATNPHCCETEWDLACIEQAQELCGIVCEN